MRISVDKDDPGYPFYLLIKHQDISVMKDGEEINAAHVFTADEEEGLLIRALCAPDGSPVMNLNNEITRSIEYGAIEIVVKERPYSAADETSEHIGMVREKMEAIIAELHARAQVHDESKFSAEEMPFLQEIGELAQREGKVAYGTPEYEKRKQILEPMLAHHYRNNDHHPEFYANGISGMTLMSLVEMFCDWAAAAQQRDPDGTMNLSFSIEKYGIPPMLAEILRNTADAMEIRHR